MSNYRIQHTSKRDYIVRSTVENDNHEFGRFATEAEAEAHAAKTGSRTLPPVWCKWNGPAPMNRPISRRPPHSLPRNSPGRSGVPGSMAL